MVQKVAGEDHVGGGNQKRLRNESSKELVFADKCGGLNGEKLGRWVDRMAHPGSGGLKNSSKRIKDWRGATIPSKSPLLKWTPSVNNRKKKIKPEKKSARFELKGYTLGFHCK